MHIAWLIEQTGITGANRVVLALADAMAARGHTCTIVTTDAPLRWRASSAEWKYIDGWNEMRGSSDFEFVIATSRDTIDAARRAAERFAFYAFDSEPPPNVRALAASRTMSGENVTYIGAIVDDDLFRQKPAREHEPPRVLLSGAAHEERRGVDDGYRAVAHARWFHQRLDLVRVSPFVPSREEPLDSVQEFHVGLSAVEMTRLMHSCDIVLAPDHREARFSLVPMEALAAAVPSVMTSIPSFLSFDAKQDFALFARDDDPVELGERLIELLEDSDLRDRLRARGREVAQQWRAAEVADRFEKFLTGITE
ncbi:MAG TPA: glycosyltransferase family 4 protein [Thermoanaerobaculia bacterium]|nr:glycosyltransferase family 4 protein [Thermoanaerobaculia bacterium]